MISSLKEAIVTLCKEVPEPNKGLPDEVFYYISQTTPLINVDLLIKDETGRTLLAWRDDQYAGRGWHVPGGIIRFKETIEARIEAVALSEIGRAVIYEGSPVAITQMINPERDIRGHFISLLYKCALPSDYTPSNGDKKHLEPGFLKWHEKCPEDLIRYHQTYKKHIEN